MTRAEAMKEVTRTCEAYANGCDHERVKRIRTALKVVKKAIRK